MKDLSLFSIIPYKGDLLKLENPVRARAYYRSCVIDLISGEKSDFNFGDWIFELQEKKISTVEENSRVIHLFYELGHLIENEPHLLNEETLLAIDCEFSSFKKISARPGKKIRLRPVFFPDRDVYRAAFYKGYDELLKGNCYQFNLTYPFVYSLDETYAPMDFISSLWRNERLRGAFGSATYVPHFKKLFLSNSPECLFQIKNKTLSTMPIKGTMKLDDSKNWKSLWKVLARDKKSQAELFMISDLLRNDLSRIEKPNARIVRKKYPKLVPGLLHQYSQIDVTLGEDVSLWRIIEKIFPGGSITGAPKRRAMKLIHQLEKRERGFYCGSSIILFKKMKSASINIRSSVIDFEEATLLYQAGGGITLLSDVEEEYREMTYKHDSFLNTLTL
ncbi:MAG: chorismate-binding protein [Bacteriovorax sp.]